MPNEKKRKTKLGRAECSGAEQRWKDEDKMGMKLERQEGGITKYERTQTVK